MGNALELAELLFELATTRARFDTIAEMMPVYYGANAFQVERAEEVAKSIQRLEWALNGIRAPGKRQPATLSELFRRLEHSGSASLPSLEGRKDVNPESGGGAPGNESDP